MEKCNWPRENGRCGMRQVPQVRQKLSRKERGEVRKRAQKGEKVYL